MANIVCAGFGGQGVLTAGLILAKTGMNNDMNVTWIPSYGSEMRGGTANCNVKISDDKIASPFVKQIDILLVMNIPSLNKFMDSVRPGGLIVSNSSIVKGCDFRDDVTVVEVDATDIAKDANNLRGANIAMLGALANSCELFSKETMEQGVEAFFLSKNKNNPLNKICFNMGYEKVKSREVVV